MSVVKEYAVGRDFHIDTPLSNLSIAYMQEQSVFVGGSIFPDLSVNKRSDVYYIFDKGDWFRVPGSTLRAPKSPPAKIEFAVSSNTYYAKNYALASEISWEDRTNADDVIELERSTVEHLTTILTLDKEKRIASAATSTSNVGSSVTLSGTDQWNDYGNSDPFQDIRLGMQAVHGTTGKQANTIIMGQEVFDVLVDHPDVLDRIKYTQRGVVNADLLASLISADQPVKVMVGGAIENTGTEGLTDSFSYVWGKNVFIGHTAPRPGRRTASFGYSFRWKPAGFRDMSVLRKSDVEGNYTDRLDLMMFADEKIVASDLSYLITSAVSG
jgi:hypothetical protein